MKKIIALICALCLCFVLVACGDGVDAAGNAAQENNDALVDADNAITDALGDLGDDIQGLLDQIN